MITGGYDWGADPVGLIPTGRVLKYNINGEVKLLPKLKKPRSNHACGHYVHNDKMVKLFSNVDL